MNYTQVFQDHKESRLYGRYLTLTHLAASLADLPKTAVSVLGNSVQNQPVYAIRLGSGRTKIFMWSQMHGNESTTTKAVFDLIWLLQSTSPIASTLLSQFEFLILPLVNPDGALAYTRENANGIDLNRDAQDRTQPESQLLRKAFDEFKPDFCFNLHDQRTIFGAGTSGHPATVSFLAPSYNIAREFNETRRQAVRVINAMNAELQRYIPNQIGRFDDGFNPNCIGDTFQMLGVPTILFEAGHYPGDYDREKTRMYIFIALLSGLQSIYENDIVRNEFDDYMNIPQNISNFYDFVYKNVMFCCDGSKIISNFAAQYKEVLQDQQIHFKAYISQVGNMENYFGHHTYDCHGQEFFANGNLTAVEGEEATFSLNAQISFENGHPI
jgi:hypothetical protein